MKIKFRRLFMALVLLALSTLNSQVATVLAQGSLTPPGAPGPTMKSLDQIEARTAITNTSSLVTISQPGSYYLTHNLTVSAGDGIDINTSGVTLDLNGFTISSTAASAAGFGISLNSGLRNITIANGFIQGGVTNNGSGNYSGSGFGFGIVYSGNAPANVLVSRVSVSGCLHYGIYLNTGSSTVVESCMVETVSGFGIVASTIKSCSAIDCGGSGISGDQISDCRGQCSGSGDGVYATAIAQNSYGLSSSGRGLYAIVAQNCYGLSSSGNGLNTTNAVNCYGQSSNGIGLTTTTALNCNGLSVSNTGLAATMTATGCFGSSSSATGLFANIANVCHGASSTGTDLVATHNINSF